MKYPNRVSFFRDFLGCGEKTWVNWYNNGTKKIYFCILDLLEEKKKHKDRVEFLEKYIRQTRNIKN
tara:strand:+ start:720 stop:917 length:198 start_codon:yes stop_codon:yes gene_type:complete